MCVCVCVFFFTSPVVVSVYVKFLLIVIQALSNLQKEISLKCIYLFLVTLQVKDPEKYNFSPKHLLDLLTDVYLNLDSETLIVSVATDDRSYSKDLFNQCVRILFNKGIKKQVCIWR